MYNFLVRCFKCCCQFVSWGFWGDLVSEVLLLVIWVWSRYTACDFPTTLFCWTEIWIVCPPVTITLTHSFCSFHINTEAGLWQIKIVWLMLCCFFFFLIFFLFCMPGIANWEKKQALKETVRKMWSKTMNSSRSFIKGGLRQVWNICVAVITQVKCSTVLINEASRTVALI